MKAKRLNGFTLIELVVVIAIIGIIMAGIMNMVAPMQDTATSTKVLNEQRTVEETIATYIGENVRYASNLLIIEEGAVVPVTSASGSTSNLPVDSAEDAIDAFFAYGPSNTTGVIAQNAENEGQVHVLKFDSDNGFFYSNRGYKGRLIASKTQPLAASGSPTKYVEKTNDLDFSMNTTSGSLNDDSEQYVVFGEGYYGPGLYRMSCGLNDNTHALEIEVGSEYYYNNSGTGKSSMTTSNPVRFTFELRNYSVGSNKYTFKAVSKTISGSGSIGSNPQPGYGTVNASFTTGGSLYFVYLGNAEDLSTDPSLTPVGSGCLTPYEVNVHSSSGKGRSDGSSSTSTGGSNPTTTPTTPSSGGTTNPSSGGTTNPSSGGGTSDPGQGSGTSDPGQGSGTSDPGQGTGRGTGTTTVG
ncbi:MAG: prepilin-type N-terminal cleavage/methylation domain-containing protein, partial [Oscillospiraceae bacterium]|nr:prepilin-type N-terminal cleavage/methylation domain-containing protein [Oscillospiraceae bacterium]